MPLLTEMTLQWPEHPSALLDSGPQSAQGHHGALAMHFSSLEAQFPHLEVEEAKRDDLKGRSQLCIARAETWGNRSSSESNPAPFLAAPWPTRPQPRQLSSAPTGERSQALHAPLPFLVVASWRGKQNSEHPWPCPAVSAPHNRVSTHPVNSADL